MKTRLTGAQKGHSMLKKKSDALTARFRTILKEIVQVFIPGKDCIIYVGFIYGRPM